MANLRFFESMNQINMAIQGASDLEQMMGNVLDVVRSIFDCDRAYLLYPCDPEVAELQVPMESAKPEYLRADAKGLKIPINEEMACKIRRLLSTDTPVKFGMTTDQPIPILKDKYGVQSLLAMALYPKQDMAWEFGIHQCSHSREWTAAEEKLLQEIGRRLTDSLTTLKANRNLQKSQEDLALLKFALDRTRDGVSLSDMQENFIYVNDACSSLGYSREELLKMKVSDIVTSSSEDSRKEYHRQLKAYGSLNFETNYKTKDNRLYPVEVDVEIFTYQGKNYKLAINRGIERRKQTEQQLKLLNHALNLSSDAAYLIDDQQRFIYVNDIACRSLGYDRQELLTMKITDLDADLSAEAVDQLVQETRALGQNIFESRHRRQDGSIFPVEISASIVKHDGQSIGLSLVRNITERKQIEKERQQGEALLQEQMHQIRSFSSKIIKAREEERRSLAHELHDEFGQVLTGIKFSLEDIKHSGEYSTKEKIDILQQDIGHLISRVRDLSMSLRPPLLDDLGLLPALQWHIERYTKQTSVQVDFKHEGIGQLISIHDEALVVFRIVQESLTNIARHAGVKKATVYITGNKNIIFVNISDEGMGFDLTKEMANSKSIGLIGMRERVEDIGGICTIKSSPAKGTQLSFQIPIS